MSHARSAEGLPLLRRAHGAALAAALLVLVLSAPATAELPRGAEPREVVTYHWDYVRDGGIFRADGSSPFADSKRYEPERGDRHEVDYREGWRLTFNTAGESGAPEFADAHLDLVREYLTPGTEVVEVSPEYTLEPADDLLEPYERQAFELAFTGGPEGTFRQTGGDRLSAGSLSGTIEVDDDGELYVSIRPLYIRMRVDDSVAFAGWPGVAATDSDGHSGDHVHARAIAFGGRVELDYPCDEDEILTHWFMRPARIPVGTVVRTETDGYARFEFADGSIVELGSRSRVEFAGRTVHDAELEHGQMLVFPRMGGGLAGPVGVDPDATLDAWQSLRTEATPVRDLGAAIRWATWVLAVTVVTGVSVWGYHLWKRRRDTAAEKHRHGNGPTLG